MFSNFIDISPIFRSSTIILPSISLETDMLYSKLVFSKTATPHEFEDSLFKIHSPFHIDLTVFSSFDVQWVSCKHFMPALVLLK